MYSRSVVIQYICGGVQAACRSNWSKITLYRWVYRRTVCTVRGGSSTSATSLHDKTKSSENTLIG